MSTSSTSIAPRRDERACRLIEWRPWPLPNPSLIGHCDVVFAGGWTVHQVPVFRGRDGISVGVPNSAVLDAEGRVRLKPDGKRQYLSVISFASNEAKARWSRMVLAALADAGIGTRTAPQQIGEPPCD